MNRQQVREFRAQVIEFGEQVEKKTLETMWSKLATEWSYVRRTDGKLDLAMKYANNMAKYARYARYALEALGEREDQTYEHSKGFAQLIIWIHEQSQGIIHRGEQALSALKRNDSADYVKWCRAITGHIHNMMDMLKISDQHPQYQTYYRYQLVYRQAV